MRGQGTVYLPKNGRGEHQQTWWYKFGHRGRVYSGSTATTVKAVALDVLAKKLREVKLGIVICNPTKVTLQQLKELHLKQYELDGLRSKDRIEQYWAHLEKFFGLETKAVDITAIHLDDYAVKRLAEGAAPQTKNNELSALRRGFTLAVEKGLLATMPTFNLVKVQNTSQELFTEGEVGALLLELPPEVRDLVEGLAAMGWRRDELRLLQWRMVDLAEGVVRLEEARSKSGQPRIFPFSMAPELKTLFEKRWAKKDGLYVFQSEGKPLGIGLIRTAWRQAKKRAGLTGKLKDLRRFAAVNFRRAGVPESVIMKLCGWKTRSVFDRYNIINEADLANAVSKRFGKTTGRQEKTPINRISLSPFTVTGPPGLEPGTPGFGDRSKYAQFTFYRSK